MERVYLIVNADDFGLNKEVNRGIIKAFNNGIVTSASLLVNRDGYEDALEKISENPKLDVGIHLNAFRGKPLTDPKRIVNKHGFFYGNNARFLFNYIIHKNKTDREIYEEFEAQILKARKDNVLISSIDTEKHMHTLPSIFRIIIELAEKHNIKAVRMPFEKITARAFFNPAQFVKLFAMLLFYPANKKTLSKSAVIAPKYLHGISISKRYSVASLGKLFKSLESGANELSCHPGLTQIEKSSYIDKYREQELAVLTDNALINFISQKNIHLINFKDLYL